MQIRSAWYTTHHTKLAYSIAGQTNNQNNEASWSLAWLLLIAWAIVPTHWMSIMVLISHSEAGLLDESIAWCLVRGYHLSENLTFPQNKGTILNIAERIKTHQWLGSIHQLGGYQCKKCCLNICSLLHPCRLKVWWPMLSLTATSSTNSPKKWTYSSAVSARGCQSAPGSFFWGSGSFSCGNYLTKHHLPAWHHLVNAGFISTLKTVMELVAH